MSEEKFLEKYTGQTTEELIELSKEYRIDSIVLAFEEAILQKGSPLNVEERTVVSIEALEREVGNGGFEQFFTNSSVEYVSCIVEDLERIGCTQLAKISAKAIGALGLQGKLSVEEIGERIDDEDEELMAVLEDCDDEYEDSTENSPANKLFEFIKENQNKITIP